MRYADFDCGSRSCIIVMVALGVYCVFCNCEWLMIMVLISYESNVNEIRHDVNVNVNVNGLEFHCYCYKWILFVVLKRNVVELRVCVSGTFLGRAEINLGQIRIRGCLNFVRVNWLFCYESIGKF